MGQDRFRLLDGPSPRWPAAEMGPQLGIPWEGALTVHAKSEYRKNRKHYSTYYTPEQRQIVADAFAKEIALFGWTFEEQSP